MERMGALTRGLTRDVVCIARIQGTSHHSFWIPCSMVPLQNAVQSPPIQVVLVYLPMNLDYL
ncbi:hypothetical protein PAXRUDRAFT_822209 [Paxillus rubicundulus Ve08.2h10]|uniref:Uncharacterized protein n=1 Tax=Paxillus rubicundulus Ve08.2h10 TaxID=930991 RepID=A0A0D0DWX8_9AGAM|nr:hypothetical protein PAXRUDRAFT_822209 [Paxillus rubicundulus Ve08.2h10]